MGQKGVNADLLQLNDSDLSAELSDLVSLGTTYVRVDFQWPDIQPNGPNDFITTNHDRIVKAVQKAGLQIVAVLAYSPTWASHKSDSIMYPPVSASDYGNFVGLVARHFGPMGVHLFEIWNEPNLGGVFWLSGANPVQYASLLKAAYPQIKAADPKSIVITGGLSPAADSAPDLSPQTFLQGLYNSGASPYFDAVGDHPYTYPAQPDASDGSNYWWTAMFDLRDIMVKGGDSAKKIWLTEYGAPTNGGSDAISEAEQAKMMTTAYSLVKTYAWAGPLIIYTYKDAGTDITNEEDFYGLVRADGSPKPAYSAFRSIVSN